MQKEIDEITAKYIMHNIADDYHSVLAEDGRKEIYARLGDIALGQVAWYPFEQGSLMQIGSDYGAVTGYLCKKSKDVTVIEFDDMQAACVKKRWGSEGNLSVITNKNFFDKIQPEYTGKFDYVIYHIRPEAEEILCEADYKKRFEQIRKYLKQDGVLILNLPNRLGARYLCGKPFPVTEIPFDGITGKNTAWYMTDRKEIMQLLQSTGFIDTYFHYPYPDGQIVQQLYSDDKYPEKEITERFSALVDSSEYRLLDEGSFLKQLINNTDITAFANDFIIESCKSKEKKKTQKVVYAAISGERERERAFVTEIMSDENVIKRPLFEDGENWIRQTQTNCLELSQHGIHVLQPEMKGTELWMRYVKSQTLSDQFRKVILNKEKQSFIDILDRLAKLIYHSSDILAVTEDETILARAYIEMIPVNCFWENESFLFFDQEYVKEKCPAEYVLFRGIKDIYDFIPETENLVPLEQTKKKYHLSKNWDKYQHMEDEFGSKLRQSSIYRNLIKWRNTDYTKMQDNRRLLQMETGKIRLFDPVYGLENRKLILFGAGRMTMHFLEQYGKCYHPEMLLDNDHTKWGTEKDGIRICNPEDVLKLEKGSYRIVIAVANYAPVLRQLNQMGIEQENFRIYDRNFCEKYLPYVIENDMFDGKYSTGFVTGVFDLFHIGHLNVLKNSKARCKYLIAGVLTDELAAQDKGTRPVVPYEERAEIVRQCKYVDEVVPIDFHNADKMIAWKELHFGCLFSGSDHINEEYWISLRKQLQSVGSELEFFPYTEQTSSTLLQHTIRGEEKNKKQDKVFPIPGEMAISVSGIVEMEHPKSGVMKISDAGFQKVFFDLSLLVPPNASEIWAEKKGDELDAEKYIQHVNRDVREDPERLWKYAEATDRNLKLMHLEVKIVRAPSFSAEYGTPEFEYLCVLVLQSIQICSKMGSHALIVPFLQSEKAEEVYQRFADEAAQYDIKLLFENNYREYNGHLIRGEFTDLSEIKKFIKRLNDMAGKDRFAICIDTGVLNVCGQDPYRYIMTMQDYIGAILLRDCQPDQIGSEMPFGVNRNGVRLNDWRGILRGLRQINYDKILMMDISDMVRAYPYILRDEILRFSAKVAGYIEWQIMLERRIRQYDHIVLFGAGKMCINYINNYGVKYPPLFTCDNNSNLWEKQVAGVTVKNPEILRSLPKGTGVFICNMYYEEIRNQLEDMEIQNIEYYNDEFSDIYLCKEPV